MTLTIDLPENDVTLLNAQASAAGLSAGQCASQLLKRALASSAARQPLPTRIRTIRADMPDEVRALRFDEFFSEGTVCTTEEVLTEVPVFFAPLYWDSLSMPLGPTKVTA